MPVDFGYFELLGIRPEAGRLFRRGSGDAVPADFSNATGIRYVINQSLVRAMGYPSAQAAVGQPIFNKSLPGMKNGPAPGVIIGVVRDFVFNPRMFGGDAERDRLLAAAYSVGTPVPQLEPPQGVLFIRLDGQDAAKTLTGVDAAWKQVNPASPISREFLSDYVRDRQSAFFMMAQAFSAFAVVAMLLACSGLFGIAQFAVERRIKEIGIRKAMGATTAELVAMLMRHFSPPVLWANLLGLPLAWCLMRWLLSVITFPVMLTAWTFLAAAAATLGIALLTVAGQAFLTARQKPVLALRYE